MSVTITISEAAESRFREVFGPDLGEAATEALLIHGYRTGRISLGFIAEVLGLSTRLEAQKWLADRKVPLNYDLDELAADRETNRQLFNVDL